MSKLNTVKAVWAIEASANPGATFRQLLQDSKAPVRNVEQVLRRLSPATLRRFDAQVLRAVAKATWGSDAVTLLMRLCSHIDPNTRMQDGNPAWFAPKLRFESAFLQHAAEFRIDVNQPINDQWSGARSLLQMALWQLKASVHSPSALNRAVEAVTALLRAGAEPLAALDAQSPQFEDFVFDLVAALGADMRDVDTEALVEALVASGLLLSEEQSRRLIARLGADNPGLARVLAAFKWQARAPLVRAMRDWTEYEDGVDEDGRPADGADFIARVFHGHPAGVEDERLVHEHAQMVALFASGGGRRHMYR